MSEYNIIVRQKPIICYFIKLYAFKMADYGQIISFQMVIMKIFELSNGGQVSFYNFENIFLRGGTCFLGKVCDNLGFYFHIGLEF